MATEIAAKRGDVAILEWLLIHFQDCEVPIETVEQAVSKGNVAILQLLLKYDTGSQEIQEPDAKKMKVATENGEADEGGTTKSAGGGHVVLWKNRGRFRRPSIMEDAIQTGHPDVARWLYANVPELSDEETVGDAVRAAMQSSSLELVEFFLPEGKTVLDYVSLAGHSAEVVEKLLDAGYFERFEVIDALALPNLAEAGRLDLLQRASKYYKRSNKHWQECWRDALFVACRLGHCAVVRWMIEHPMWRGVRNLLKRKRTYSRLMWFAADRGSVEVMRCLHDLGAADSYGNALVKAVAKNDLNCINWLLANFPQSEHVSDYAVLDEAARRGNLELLKYFHSLESVPGFVPKTASVQQQERHGTVAWESYGTLVHLARCGTYRGFKDDRLGERSSWYSTDAMDDAAANGHLLVVQWLHENRSEGCTTEAMDCAAANGHLEVVKWLHSNRSEGFTTKAMDGAASHGHLDVVQWLHTNTSACCTTEAMDGAAKHGKLKVLKWLHSNRSEGCTVEAIEKAFTHAHLGVALWLAATFPYLAPETFSCYSDASKFDVTLFVHAHYPVLIGTQEYCFNQKTSNNYRWNWLKKHYLALHA